MGEKGTRMTGDAPVTFDRIADALGHQVRRRVLVGLLEKNPQDVRETIVADGGSDGATTEVELVHVHLPKLEDLGYISWDKDSGTLLKGNRWDEIEPTLRLLHTNRAAIPADTF